MSNHFYRQYITQLNAAHRMPNSVLGREQPQPQPGARLNVNPQNSRLTVQQSHQLHQVQPQPQPQPHHQITGSPTLPNTRPRDDISNVILDRFLSQLRDQQQHITDSLAKSDKCLETLVSSVSSIRATVDGLATKLETHDRAFEKLERSGSGDSRMKAKEIDVMKVLVGEMKAFKKTLGKSRDGDDGRTVLGRLDAVTFAVGELLERARDPEANLSEPSAPIIAVPPPPIIDLTMSLSPDPPSVRSTPPLQSHTYADVGTSPLPVPSPPPLKERHFASIQVSTSPQPSLDSFDSFLRSPLESTPYSNRFPSAHTLDNTNASPDMGSTALPRESLELAAPAPMDVDLVAPTNPTPDSQISASSTIDTNDSEDVIPVQPTSQLSDNAPATMENEPYVKNTVHPVTHSDLASPERAQTPQNITGLDGPAHMTDSLVDDNAGLSNVTPESAIPTFDLALPESAQTPQNITGLDEPVHTNERPVDHNAILNVTPGPTSDILTLEQPTVSAPAATSSTSPAFPTDNMNPESLTAGADRTSHDEEKTKRDKEKGKGKKEEEIKRIDKRNFELSRNHDNDVPLPPPGLIDLSQHLRGRPRSSSGFASPSASLTSLSVRGIAGSALSVDALENVPRSPNTKLYSPTRTRVLAGTSRSPWTAFHAAAAFLTPSPSATVATTIPAATQHSFKKSTTSNITKIPPTAPIVSPQLELATASAAVAFLTPSPPATVATTSNATKIPLTAPIVSSQLELTTASAAATPTTPLSVTSPVIDTLLLRELSPLSDMESDVDAGNETTEATVKGQLSNDFITKRETSLFDDADIVHAKKRRISEVSSTVKLGLEEAGPVAKGKPSILSLKIGQKGESAAVTRVKKRRVTGSTVDDDELNQERPLKRARQRASDWPEMRMGYLRFLKDGKRLTRELSGSSLEAESSTRVNKPRPAASGSGTVATRDMTSSSASTSVKVKRSTPSKGRLSARGHGKLEVEWPKITQGDRTEDLVECNKCKAWYHYGCVGITTSDIRLHDGKNYLCPPCEAGIVIKKPTQESDCWRPGCIVPTGFVVEKIIGRFKKVVEGQGIQFKYLLRWKGYKLSESTWEPEESMYDPPFMIDKFRIDALEEGIDIDKDKTGLVLLRIAKHPCVPKPI